MGGANLLRELHDQHGMAYLAVTDRKRGRGSVGDWRILKRDGTAIWEECEDTRQLNPTRAEAHFGMAEDDSKAKPQYLTASALES
jgi:hypothetical protein